MTLGLGFPATLAAARVGTDWAWTDLYRDLAPSVLRYLRAHDVDRADDLLEEVFIRMVHDLPGFTGHEDEFRAWVFTITHQRLLDEWKRTGRHPEIPCSPCAEQPSLGTQRDDPDVEAFGSTDEVQVCAIMARLTNDQREVLFLRLIGGLSLEQTAQALGRTPGSVKALQSRGLQAISRHLPSQVVAT